MSKSFVSNFLKGLLSTSSGTAATILFHFLSIIVIVKFVPEEDFGLYVLILAVVHFLRIIGGLGFDLTLVKFISAGDQEDDFRPLVVIAGTRLAAALILSLITFLAGHLIGALLDPRINDYILFLPLLFILSSFKELVYYFFQGMFWFKRYAEISIFSAAAKFLLILLLTIFNRLNLDNLIYLELLTLAATLTVAFFWLPYQSLKKARFNTSLMGEIFRFGMPLYLNNILTFIYERASLFMIGALLDPVSVAYYAVAEKIPEGFRRMFSSFIAVYFPNLSQLFYQEKNSDAERLMNRSLVFLSAGGGLLALISFLFRKEIIALVFSQTYLIAGMAFALLMANFLINAVGYTMGYSLVSAGYSRIPVKVNFVASAINIAANLLFIPKFGFMGAVYSLLIMSVAAHFGNYYFLLRAKIHPGLKRYLLPVVLCAILAAIQYLLHINDIWMKLLIVPAYCIGCFFLLEEIRSLLKTGLRTAHQFTFKTGPLDE